MGTGHSSRPYAEIADALTRADEERYLRTIVMVAAGTYRVR